MTENDKMLSESRARKLEVDMRALTQTLESERIKTADLEAALAKER